MNNSELRQQFIKERFGENPEELFMPMLSQSEWYDRGYVPTKDAEPYFIKQWVKLRKGKYVTQYRAFYTANMVEPI